MVYRLAIEVLYVTYIYQVTNKLTNYTRCSHTVQVILLCSTSYVDIFKQIPLSKLLIDKNCVPRFC